MTTTSARPAPSVPPGPPLRAGARLFKQLATDRLALMSEAARDYGDAVKITIGPKTLYFFNHPDHARHVLADNAANYHKGIGLVQARRAIGDGLLTSEGALWKEQRNVIRPVFRHQRISAQADVITEEAEALAARLAAHAGGPPVDVVAELTGLTLGVLGRTLLDADLGRFTGIAHAFEAVQDQAMFEMVTLGAVPMWVPLPHQLRFRKARRELDRVVATLVAERRAAMGEDDVVSRLIRSVDREADPAVARTRLRDELVTLLLAGHETTASTLGWAFHLLDRHPDVADRVRDEVASVVGDGPVRFAHLHGLAYTVQVLQEVMRLYPPVWILPRQAQAADVVGGYGVPAGADVVICPFTLHRHPAFWPDPERFDPGRFDGSAEGRPKFAHLPFGAGPRFCVGNSLGMVEATIVLATVVRSLRLAAPAGASPTPEPMLSLRVRGGLSMRVSRR
ncbi:cytochrome P450 [Actinocorallia sp. A-T 12471]|uniref:cytochrome P450 n=1 Tax=Actinocorallia sp. A-T 12471 TaxID=3089813 RepID=UPI0029D2FAD2|nr:cytochrome P450 [Actinocorallia sp. A-T 12471]MDX6741614.1 cytochrome P450 [Actinocorallia sp. A-T 12471]